MLFLFTSPVFSGVTSAGPGLSSSRTSEPAAQAGSQTSSEDNDQLREKGFVFGYLYAGSLKISLLGCHPAQISRARKLPGLSSLHLGLGFPQTHPLFVKERSGAGRAAETHIYGTKRDEQRTKTN